MTIQVETIGGAVTGIKKEVFIGECRLILGDSVDILGGGISLESVITDPPYGMNFKSNHRGTSHDAIEGDDSTKLLEFACSLKPSHSLYVWMRWNNLPQVPMPKSLITWVKNNWSMGDLKHEHARQTEVAAFYAGPNHSFNTRPSDVVSVRRTQNSFHPTQKPIALMQSNISWTKGVVCDPFMGSGTTGVACAKMNRKFIGIEINPQYFEIACERIRDAYKQPDMFTTLESPTIEAGIV